MLWIQDIDSIHVKFDSISDREQDYGDKNLVCSMITIFENAVLRRTLFLVTIAISKNVRILFSINFTQCDLEHKHNQCECDSIRDEKNNMLVIVE